jgi:hypothetical protein
MREMRLHQSLCFADTRAGCSRESSSGFALAGQFVPAAL